ncbi:MAG: presenilin family intramembrane aspartyl protease PSH [Haloarculaceae archaeon]
MDQRRSVLAATGGIFVLFLLVQVGTLALVEPFEASGLQPDVDHGDPTNSLLYVGAILVATAFMLLAFKFEVANLVRGLIVFSGAYVAVFVFRVVIPPLFVVANLHALAWLAGILLGLALWFYPEWYVVDAAGVVMGIAAAALFGITFGVLPALVLLVVLAVYDAISVYRTEHMLTLAGGVMEMRVPIVLVVPLSISYSFLDADLPDPTAEGEGEEDDKEAVDREAEAVGEAEEAEEASAEVPAAVERDALFIGLGDAVIPTVLVASAAFFAPGSPPSLGVPYLAMTLPTLSAMVGTFAGLAGLLWMVLQGRAHAGLPLLNGGTILGFLAGSVLAGVGLFEALGLSGFL